MTRSSKSSVTAWPCPLISLPAPPPPPPRAPWPVRAAVAGSARIRKRPAWLVNGSTAARRAMLPVLRSCCSWLCLKCAMRCCKSTLTRGIPCATCSRSLRTCHSRVASVSIRGTRGKPSLGPPLSRLQDIHEYLFQLLDKLEAHAPVKAAIQASLAGEAVTEKVCDKCQKGSSNSS